MFQMLKEFKKFILRGNVVDLAVAVVIGAAFGGIVTALVNDFITPLIAALGGQHDFSGLTFTLNNSVFHYGDFFNKLVSFVLIAGVIFFFVVQPINRLLAIANRDKDTDEPTTKKCPECFSEINIKSTRCAFCTAKLTTSKN